ncbi:hypothetical protein [Paenibacillus sp. V4I5]|uniref:hypothetical protein n=1 Tax=Paenibacillus sp. V4I5 TaxID=3042306 RepID=UPI00278F59ED|nr:hypothetical protein [Paenibacillus sp. V4I5]MDQ0917615.1 hypothetical protein [Paenibacillus sp. V4I5]
MGTSNWQNVSYCIEMIRRIKPESILDVGVGFGRWGIICREFLDVWNGKVERGTWDTRIEGIEAFSANIDEYHKNFYTKIWEIDASDYFSSCKEKYNLIIFGDVLEHFYKDEGNKLLNMALEMSDYVMINIPLGENWEQGDLYGNKYEEHKSEWYVEDFEKYPIIRKRLFRDYIGREFATILLSKNSIISNQLLKQTQIDNEMHMIQQEMNEITEYYNLLKKKKTESEHTLETILTEGENKILNAAANEKVLIKVRIGNNINKNSNGNEVWIYHITSDEIPAIDLNKIKRDDKWITRMDQSAPTGTCLIASEIGAELQFEIVGETLKLKCLSHPWSGNIEIVKNDEVVLKVDLYSANQKKIDIIINLKGVD